MMKNRSIYIDNMPLDEAKKRWYKALLREGCLKALPSEETAVDDSLGRITAEPVFARHSSPFYNASAMDGIAVRFRDLAGANESNRVVLSYPEDYVPINTGNPIPQGFDAVVMIEDVQPAGDDKVEIITPVTPWANVRTIGEDIVATELIIPEGHRIRPIDIGAMLATSVNSVRVRKIPRVIVIPTGSELVQPGDPIGPGNIIEFNSRILTGYLSQWGADATRSCIVPDDKNSIIKAIEDAVSDYDMVIINAGASAGTKDYTSEVLKELGDVIVHGVNIKPGKPVILAIVKGKPVIGLPGYPVSAVVTMRLFAREIVSSYLGVMIEPSRYVSAILSRPLASKMGVENFVRIKLGRVGKNLMATPSGSGAGAVMSLAQADGIIIVPASTEGVGAGETVQVELLRDMEEVENTLVFIGSHDNILDLLANFLHKQRPSYRLSSAHVGSMGGIMAVKRNEAHIAGTHLLDEKTGEYNIPFIQRFLKNVPLILVNLAYREQGLVVPKGNPANIGGIEDIVKSDLRFINRQKGAGTRLLTDMLINKLAIDTAQIKGYDHEEYTHMNVASAVASSRADAGMAIKAAAEALKLDFIPVGEERYDLIIPKIHADDKKVKAVLKTIRENKDFKTTVESMGGYDLRDSGKIVYEQ